MWLMFLRLSTSRQRCLTRSQLAATEVRSALPVPIFLLRQTYDTEPQLTSLANHVSTLIFVFNQNSTFWASTNAWAFVAVVDPLCRTSGQYFNSFVLSIATWISAGSGRPEALPFVKTNPAEVKLPASIPSAHRATNAVYSARISHAPRLATWAPLGSFFLIQKVLFKFLLKPAHFRVWEASNMTNEKVFPFAVAV